MSGQSPPKLGAPPKILDVLLQVLSTHVEVSQVSNGELKGARKKFCVMDYTMKEAILAKFAT